MSPDDPPTLSRRRLLAGSAVALAATSGCVTTGMQVQGDLSGSNVFESVSLMESWTANQATAKLALTDTATTELNVRRLAVIDSQGSSVWTGAVEPAQTSVSNVMLPVGSPVTLAAANASGEFVDRVEITVVGDTVP
ncbi:hypothetical protein ACFO0N_17810 [Halobium salinum]|uniref:Uncharacterized protein n=1 Tax=Halobium salinum TaxID=1364940 RepID=A0ABD5PGG5_9EURY|nr:hypothetical protein [Halobium salinum]